MKTLDKINKFIKIHVDDAECAFNNQLSTDENTDYRRGFCAGVLFSFLQIKAEIGNINAATEQPIDKFFEHPGGTIDLKLEDETRD